MILCVFSFSVCAEGAKKYVVLGDSIAYGSGLLNPTKAVYGKIVADTNGYDYENFAIPGHMTEDLLRRLDQNAVSSAVSEADIISISIGGNNFLRGNLAALVYDGIVNENYARFDEIAEEFYVDLGKIIDKIREKNADTAILLQTIYNPQTSYIGEVYQQGADRINAKIWEYAEENPGSVIIVDVASRLTDSDKDFADDRTHPSVIGNEKIAKAVLETLAENGLGSETEPVITTKGIDVKGTAFFIAFFNAYGQILHVFAQIKGRIFR